MDEGRAGVSRPALQDVPGPENRLLLLLRGLLLRGLLLRSLLLGSHGRDHLLQAGRVASAKIQSFGAGFAPRIHMYALSVPRMWHWLAVVS